MTVPNAPDAVPVGPVPKKPPIPSWVVLGALIIVALFTGWRVIRTPDQTSAILTTMITPLGVIIGYWQSVRNAESLVAQHHQMNSRMDQLLTVSKEASHAEGLAEGKAIRDSVP